MIPQLIRPKGEHRHRGHNKKQRHDQFKDTSAILEANATFYTAFSTLDYGAMHELWLPDNSSICIFPSSKPLRGFANILKSWKHAVESMDGNDLRNWMAPEDVRFEFMGTNRATIVCDELVFFSTTRRVRNNVFQQTDVVNKFRARNMFKKVGNRWYLCYHEAFMAHAGDATTTVAGDWTIGSVSSEDSTRSKSTFLTLMTNKAERKRDRGSLLGFLNFMTCNGGACAS